MLGLRLWLWSLTPLSTVFQLYRGGQLHWLRKPEYPEKNIDMPPVNVVSSAPRPSGIRTHNFSGDRH